MDLSNRIARRIREGARNWGGYRFQVAQVPASPWPGQAKVVLAPTFWDLETFQRQPELLSPPLAAISQATICPSSSDRPGTQTYAHYQPSSSLLFLVPRQAPTGEKQNSLESSRIQLPFCLEPHSMEAEGWGSEIFPLFSHPVPRSESSCGPPSRDSPRVSF